MHTTMAQLIKALLHMHLSTGTEENRPTRRHVDYGRMYCVNEYYQTHNVHQRSSGRMVKPSISQPLTPAGHCPAAGQKRSSFYLCASLAAACLSRYRSRPCTGPACITHLVLHGCSNGSCIRTYTISM